MMLSQPQKRILAFIGIIFFPGIVSATLSTEVLSLESAFQRVGEDTVFPIQTPSVVEISVPGPMLIQSSLVEDMTLGSAIPSVIRSERLLMPVPYDIYLSKDDLELGKIATEMNDRNTTSFVAFPIEVNALVGKKELFIKTQEPITSSGLSFTFDNNVTLPATVDIRVVAPDGQETVVVAERGLIYSAVNFPRTTASLWHITFTYRQPVRITEFVLTEDFPKYTDRYFLRFPATPEHAYRIFTHPDRYVDNIVGMQYAGNLSYERNVLGVIAPAFFANSSFKESDADADGVPDKRDNCVNIANVDQKDINSNNIGEACEDYDRDAIVNAEDNCPTTVNSDQRDVDADGMGDACDSQDSRFTEEHPWIPWVGIGSAGAVLVLLFVLTIKAKKLNEEEGVSV